MRRGGGNGVRGVSSLYFGEYFKRKLRSDSCGWRACAQIDEREKEKRKTCTRSVRVRLVAKLRLYAIVHDSLYRARA